MTEGDVALAMLPQADGQLKPRPVVLLRQMPPFADWLVCGISTQLRQQVAGFDEIVEPSHPDFRRSGLRTASLIRLSFLTVTPANEFVGTIGSISAQRHARLLQKLSAFLVAGKNL